MSGRDRDTFERQRLEELAAEERFEKQKSREFKGLGFKQVEKPASDEEEPEARKAKVKKPTLADVDAEHEQMMSSKRGLYVQEDEDEDTPQVVQLNPEEAAEVAKTLVVKTPQEKQREHEHFQEVNPLKETEREEKKKHSGSLKLKGLQLKGAGKAAHFERSAVRQKKETATLEYEVAGRVKVKHDKFC